MSSLTRVQVVRYIRPYVYSKINNASGQLTHWSNMGGLTFLFDMDYVNRTVSIRFSICRDDDNFDKEDGKAYAEDTAVFMYDLNKFRGLADKYGGFTEAFVNILQFMQLNEKVPSRVKKLLQKVDEYRETTGHEV